MMIKGLVVHGAGQAKGFEVPTANLNSPERPAEPGIYAATAAIAGEDYQGICFIGRAWLLPDNPERIEMHLFDYDGGDFYDEELSIELKKKLREPMEFTDEAQARRVINEDMAAARAYFEQH